MSYTVLNEYQEKLTIYSENDSAVAMKWYRYKKEAGVDEFKMIHEMTDDEAKRLWNVIKEYEPV